KFGMDDYGLAKHPEGITTDPESVHEDADEEDEAEDVVETPTDMIVDRAFKASIFGFFLCPPLVHFYSLFLLLQIVSPRTAVSPEKQGKYWMALAIDLALIGALLLVFIALLVRPVFNL
ncbi:MAG TPA: hypothetical protein VE988_26805, partial [Gemmataceae bacterium]|nr:hypothetical protein [Gemmataceae bacterium]